MTGAALSAKLSAKLGALSIDVEFELSEERLVLLGPNGAGKTTILSLMLGLAPVNRGRLSIGERLLFDTERGISVPVEQRRIGYVPQDFCLFPHLSVFENVAFAARAAGVRSDRNSLRLLCERLLDDLELTELSSRSVPSLSGGEKQRVALARALAIEPCALFLDEPLSALDVRARSSVREYLVQKLQALGIPTIVSTHDPADARALASQIAIVESGHVTQRGSWDAIATDPRSDFVRQLTSRNGPV
jgi:molybdate transport system ATP-binding protein